MKCDPARLLERSPDAYLLRETIGFPAERPMELEVGGQTGSAHGEKRLERVAQSDGYGVATGTGPGGWGCVSLSPGRAAASLVSSSLGGWRSKR